MKLYVPYRWSIERQLQNQTYEYTPAPVRPPWPRRGRPPAAPPAPPQLPAQPSRPAIVIHAACRRKPICQHYGESTYPGCSSVHTRPQEQLHPGVGDTVMLLEVTASATAMLEAIAHLVRLLQLVALVLHQLQRARHLRHLGLQEALVLHELARLARLRPQRPAQVAQPVKTPLPTLGRCDGRDRASWRTVRDATSMKT
jgi:hypothetical protein